MDEQTQAKLDAALARRASATAEVEVKKAAEAKEAADREAQRENARKQWPKSLQQIEAAVTEVNARVSSHGLQFKIAGPAKPESAAIAQLFILLKDEKIPNDKGRNLVLNVNAFGLVQPVGLGPHSLGAIKNFSIHEADQAYYEQILTDYLALLFK